MTWPPTEPQPDSAPTGDARVDGPGTVSPERRGLRFGRRTLLRSAWSATALAFLQACTRSDRAVSPTSSADPTTTAGASSTTSPATTTTWSPPTTSSATSTTTSTTASSSTSSTTTTTTTTTTEAPPDTTTPDTTDPGGPGDPLPPGAFDPEALYVALYGHPGSQILGVLGEQDAEAGVERARLVAAAYEGFGKRVVPTFELIASVAAADAGGDGDYSNEFSYARFEPHIEAAAANGMHVVCDLQPGRSRFPDQAREYEALWLQPHVSIALDPEWRVGPTERPGGGFIGTVDAAEVNETIDYIDSVIVANGLPRKLCIVHQFAETMITNKPLIRGTGHVQVLIQMDGFGPLDLKRGTWGRVVSSLPPGALTGWKNFYDEDRPTPTPAQTMANDPQPSYVSYQ